MKCYLQEQPGFIIFKKLIQNVKKLNNLIREGSTILAEDFEKVIIIFFFGKIQEYKLKLCIFVLGHDSFSFITTINTKGTQSYHKYWTRFIL